MGGVSQGLPLGTGVQMKRKRSSGNVDSALERTVPQGTAAPAEAVGARRAVRRGRLLRPAALRPSASWRVDEQAAAIPPLAHALCQLASHAVSVPVALNAQLPTRLGELPTRLCERCWCMVLLELRGHEVLWQPGRRKSVPARTLKAGSAERYGNRRKR